MRRARGPAEDLMPTYVYECNRCGEELEVWQSFKDEPLKRHSDCGGKLVKVLQPVGIVLKGPGFYKTDSRNGKKRDGGSGGDGGSGESGSKAADSKGDTKAGSNTDGKKSDTKKADAKPSKSSTTS
jgi:putative FmdB family regulatory protein